MAAEDFRLASLSFRRWRGGGSTRVHGSSEALAVAVRAAVRGGGEGEGGVAVSGGGGGDQAAAMAKDGGGDLGRRW